MTWKRRVAQAAGGVGGFIAGNIPGAAIGYKAAGALYDWRHKMAPIPRRKRKYTTSLSVKKKGFKTRRQGKRPRFSKSGGQFKFKRLQTVARKGGRRSRGPMDDAASTGTKVIGRRRRRVMLKGFKKVLGPRVVRGSTSTKISYAANTQTASVLNCFPNPGSPVQTHVAGFYDLTEVMDNVLVDEYQGTTSNVNSYRSLKWFVSKIRMVHRMRNMSTAPVNLQVYDVVARKDQTTGAQNPLEAWRDGLDDVRVAAFFPNTWGTSAVTVGNVGVTPFLSPKFTKLYKVKRVHEFTLHPGVTHKHYVNVFPNKMWNGEEIKDFSYHSGISTWTMVVAKGDVGQDSAATPQVVYTDGVVEVLSEYEAKAYMFQKSKSLVTWYDDLGVATGPIEQVVEDTDVVAVTDHV